MQDVTITTVKKSLLTPPSISTPISHIPHPIPKGIIGETAMHLDISLTNVNVGMPLSVQDKYLVEGRSLYLIKPLDVQVVALCYRYEYCYCHCYCCFDIVIFILLLVLLLLLLPLLRYRYCYWCYCYCICAVLPVIGRLYFWDLGSDHCYFLLTDTI